MDNIRTLKLKQLIAIQPFILVFTTALFLLKSKQSMFLIE